MPQFERRRRLRNGPRIVNPKSLVRLHIKHYAYNACDCWRALLLSDDPNSLTDRQRIAVNNGLRARSPRAF